MAYAPPPSAIGYQCKVIVKESEGFVIFLLAGPPAWEGGPPTALDPKVEEAAALMEMTKWQAATGNTCYRFHKDPMAGGLQAVVPPKGQMWRGGEQRSEVFAVPPSGQFKRNEKTGELHVGGISQGKVGPLIVDAGGEPILMESNIERGNAQMVATAAWTAQF